MIALTREFRCSFEAASAADAPEAANSWAGWPTAVGIAPFFRVQATIAGDPDPTTGYLCDIKVLDDLLRAQVLTELRKRGALGTTPEHLIQALWDQLAEKRPGGAQVTALRLHTTPYQSFAICRARISMILLTEQFEFSAAHRLHCPDLSDAENRNIFGKCNNPHGHGHNYVFDVVVAGTPDEKTGLLAPRLHLAEVVKREVLDRFDHKHLNEDTAEFRELNPTVENIARVIYNLLKDRLGPVHLQGVRVYETPKTWADYPG